MVPRVQVFTFWDFQCILNSATWLMSPYVTMSPTLHVDSLGTWLWGSGSSHLRVFVLGLAKLGDAATVEVSLHGAFGGLRFGMVHP